MSRVQCTRRLKTLPSSATTAHSPSLRARIGPYPQAGCQLCYVTKSVAQDVRQDHRGRTAMSESECSSSFVEFVEKGDCVTVFEVFSDRLSSHLVGFRLQRDAHVQCEDPCYTARGMVGRGDLEPAAEDDPLHILGDPVGAAIRMVMHGNGSSVLPTSNDTLYVSVEGPDGPVAPQREYAIRWRAPCLNGRRVCCEPAREVVGTIAYSSDRTLRQSNDGVACGFFFERFIWAPVRLGPVGGTNV